MTAATLRRPVRLAIRVVRPMILTRQKRSKHGLMRDYRAMACRTN